MKVVTIIENNPITGVVYGTQEIADNPGTVSDTKQAARQYQRALTKKAMLTKKRAENTKNK